MKIFLLTPIYATTTQGCGATPVVHYFAKEWVKQGHEVYVYNLQAKFPSVYYWVAKRFQKQIYSRTGIPVPSQEPVESYEVYGGVNVRKVCLRKMFPHSEYRSSQIDYAVKVIEEGCKEFGIPDVFIGHWDNPQLDVLIQLRRFYNRSVALVLHSNDFNLEKTYGGSVVDRLKQIDVIGFRSLVAKKKFEGKYFVPKKSFIASSGVSENFIQAGKDFNPSFDNGVHNFVFVGSLISRKYPCEILKALSTVYKDKDFKMTYIGDGQERKAIETYVSENNLETNVIFTGRIGRDQIINHLKNAEVFVMISSGEVFGLVYLEAMALGLIPIGSKEEGIDGIIRDGGNGFLCRAGDESDLARKLNSLCEMSSRDLEIMSNNAKNTALEYTDSNVAIRYLECLE